jgi:hypothetical protein
MHLNPFANAIIAAAYIWGVVSLIQLISPGPDTPDTWLTPIMALSLLVFSVALMGFLFFYRPVVLLLENKKEEASSFFLKTLGTFGVITVVVITSLVFFFGAAI